MIPMARRHRRTFLGFELRDWIIALQAGAAITLLAWASAVGAFSIGGQ